MTNPISCCFITRGEPTLEAAVASVRPHVAEICIVNTNLNDHARLREVQRLADVSWAERYCTDENGEMADFSVARNRSFSLATQPWIMWLDSDDELVGGEHLGTVLASMQGLDRVRAVCRYEYAHDPESGACVLEQWRERIVRNDGAYHWVRPVHENLVAKDGRNEDLRVDLLTWKHRRASGGDACARNLRILRAYVEKHGIDDPRIRYDLGCELANAGELDEAVEHLTRYLEESGRNDERALACKRLGQILGGPGAIGNAIHWTKRALDYQPDFFDAKLTMARLYLVRGLVGGKRDDFEHAITWSQLAAACPAVSLTPTNPQDRAAVHEVEHRARKALGDEPGAEVALESALHVAPGDPRLLLLRPRAPAKGLDVAFACPYVPEPWNPRSAARHGIGGSETAVIEVARRLAAKGHRVRVFTSCGAEGLYDGVEYLESLHLTELDEVDVLVGWRNAMTLDAAPARSKVLWVHDTEIARPSPWRLSLADRVVALTEWHARHLCEAHGTMGLRPDAMTIIGNGIDHARFGAFERGRHPRRAIYSSSYDRGLEILLDLWPRIRAEVSDAQLRIFYGAKWLRAQAAEFTERIEGKAQALAGAGVSLHGRIDQQALAREMLSAGAWLYPSWSTYRQAPWFETYCITAVEAQAAGLRVVCSPHGALAETVRAGVFVAGDATSAEWQDDFVRRSVEALSREEAPGEREAIASSVRDITWDAVAEKWDAMLVGLMNERKAAAE